MRSIKIIAWKLLIAFALVVLLFSAAAQATSPEITGEPGSAASEPWNSGESSGAAEGAFPSIEEPDQLGLPAPAGVISLFTELREVAAGATPRGVSSAINRSMEQVAKREGLVRIAAGLDSPGQITPGQVIRFGSFDGKQYLIKIRQIHFGPETYTLSGQVESSNFGVFHMSTTGVESMAILRLPEENKAFFLNYNSASGRHHLYEVALDQIDRKESLPALLPPGSGPGQNLTGESGREQLASDLPTGESSLRLAPQNEMLMSPANPAVIDVMVVYTQGAKGAAGGTAGINNVISLALLNAQEALTNSNTGITMNLVYTAEVNYIESNNGSTDLERLTGTGDGYMDEVHTWRNLYGADLVALFANVNYGGIAWLYQGNYNEADYGFNVTRVQQAHNTYSHIHEMGHNMGAHHHKQQNFQPGPNTAVGGYAAGWRFQAGSKWYNTLMAYSGGQYYPSGPGAGITSTEIGYFSNPAVNYQGVPTGHAVDGDNARALRETKHIIAAYRSSEVNFYSLTVNSTNPSSGVQITSTSGHGGTTGYHRSIAENWSVELEAPEYFGSGENRKRFNSWSGAVSGESRSITLTMDAGKTVTANYINDPVGGTTGFVEVLIEPEGARSDGARWSIDSGASWQDSGAELELLTGAYTVTFSELQGQGWQKPADYELTVTSAVPVSYTGTYSRLSYEVGLSTAPAEGGTVVGGGTYEYGESVTVTATPAVGYEFANWTDDGEVVSADAEYTFNVRGNRTLVANFVLKSYSITVSAEPAQGGSVTGAGSYTHGDSVTVAAIPAEGYEFANWTEGEEVVSTDAEYTFNAWANRELVANFVIAPTLLYPEDKASLADKAITFTWEPLAGATRYELEITRQDTGRLFKRVVINSGTTSRQTGFPATAAGTPFTWRVRAYNSLTGWGEYSTAYSFASLALPGIPRQSTPANRARLSGSEVTFSWRSVIGAGKYELEITNLSEGGQPQLVEVGTVTAHKLTLVKSGLTADYRWRIRAGNASGWGSWSRYQNFSSLDAPAAPPVHVQPAAGATLSGRTQLFSWQPVAGATQYRLEIVRKSDGKVFRSVLVRGTTSSRVSGFSPTARGTGYRWRVMAGNSAGWGPWSEYREFSN